MTSCLLACERSKRESYEDQIFHSGPGCNVSLNFLKLISQICQYFLLKKCEKLASLIFSTKNISGFSYKVIKHLTS